jgi:hypothetical protein
MRVRTRANTIFILHPPHLNPQVCLEDEKQYYQRRNALTIIVKLINADKEKTAPPVSHLVTDTMSLPLSRGVFMVCTGGLGCWLLTTSIVRLMAWGRHGFNCLGVM